MQHPARYAPYTLTLLRIAVAIVVMVYGWQKIVNFPAPPASGMPTEGVLFWLGAWIELLGGELVLFGFFTRTVAFVVFADIAVTYWLFHSPEDPYAALMGGDAAIFYCILFLLLVFTGPGAGSFDAAIRNRRAAPT